MRVTYNDGDEVETHIYDLINQAKDVSSLSLFAYPEFHNSPVRYHLCPERGNLLRHLDFTGLDVLELGAGMGGASRCIAESAKSFLAVEGTPRRMQALKKRLRDLKNWDSVVSNIDTFETDRRFDVVCLVGVLEYAELYLDAPEGGSPFARMMEKAGSFLKPGGVVMVAIENRNGIKYWAGAPEDHTGQMFDGICGYPFGKTVKTFSRARLLQFFREVGLADVEEFYPWPDYKTPHAVISKRFSDSFPELAADIAVDAIMREGISTVRYFPTTLAIYETIPSGLFNEFANSFLFIGGREQDSFVRQCLFRKMEERHECAWHYSLSREAPICTSFSLEPGYKAQPLVKKDVLGSREGEYKSKLVSWHKQTETPVHLEPKVAHLLRRLAYFEGREGFEEEFLRFLAWSIERWTLDADHLHGEAFDAIAPNAVKGPDSYRNFDLEWHLKEPMSKSWFVYRNVYNMARAMALFRKTEYANAEELYNILCEKLNITPDMHSDILKEAAVQADICSHQTPDGLYAGFKATMQTPIHGAVFPRDATAEQFLRRDLVDNPEAHTVLKSLQEDNRRLNEQLSRRCVRIGLALDARLRRIRPLFSLARKGYSWRMRLKKR